MCVGWGGGGGVSGDKGQNTYQSFFSFLFKRMFGRANARLPKRARDATSLSQPYGSMFWPRHSPFSHPLSYLVLCSD